MKDLILKSFQEANIKIDGSNPWDILVHNDKFYNRVFSEGNLGLGESYMDGWWDCQRIDQFIHKLLSANLRSKIKLSLPVILQGIRARFFNLQSKYRAFTVGKEHYDIGNDLFSKMLDKNMTYSCAYWKEAKNLDDAQIAKLELICKKIHLKAGMKILDIGVGWGAFAKYAAEKYDVEVEGITVSKEQLELAKERCKGLPVVLKYQDWREINGYYDRIVSVGQMEHVGYKNYRAYMKLCHRSLSDHGIFLLHTIGNYKSYRNGDPWMLKYIFPNGMIPSSEQLTQAANSLFILEDVHSFGTYYDNTLMAWYDNFLKNWESLKQSYNERFFRMWSYYLLSCAAIFRNRDLQLWQFVFSKKGIPGGYHSFR